VLEKWGGGEANGGVEIRGIRHLREQEPRRRVPFFGGASRRAEILFCSLARCSPRVLPGLALSVEGRRLVSVLVHPGQVFGFRHHS